MDEEPSNMNFVHRLYRMLEDPEEQETVFWNEAGTVMIIFDVGVFIQTSLYKHFNPMTKFRSFVRKMYWYVFYFLRTCPNGCS